ncbi:MAG: phosphoribosylglycinamide formyltransferase, partial [Planctomycetota bacterium]|nr:phosphoribosylglycinamide formyltransferase [Planctomycetota bacterium]
MTKSLRLVVLLSGSGSSLENIFTHIAERALPARVVHVISSRPDAYGLVRAHKHGVPTSIVPSRDFRRRDAAGAAIPDWPAMSAALNDIILPLAPDLVCLAGFMCKYLLPPPLAGKAMNIHPALIPAFCGQGMYGMRVHEAVVKAGVKITGCTVHFVTNEYDAGPIILQRACPVYDTDTPEDVQRRVFREECEAYPEAIRLYAEG